MTGALEAIGLLALWILWYFWGNRLFKRREKR
jgi:hypothetical protein